jgi:hypothetical protein
MFHKDDTMRTLVFDILARGNNQREDCPEDSTDQTTDNCPDTTSA